MRRLALLTLVILTPTITFAQSGKMISFVLEKIAAKQAANSAAHIIEEQAIRNASYLAENQIFRMTLQEASAPIITKSISAPLMRLYQIPQVEIKTIPCDSLLIPAKPYKARIDEFVSSGKQEDTFITNNAKTFSDIIKHLRKEPNWEQKAEFCVSTDGDISFSFEHKDTDSGKSTEFKVSYKGGASLKIADGNKSYTIPLK
jgi:hypothetical protein